VKNPLPQFGVTALAGIGGKRFFAALRMTDLERHEKQGRADAWDLTPDLCVTEGELDASDLTPDPFPKGKGNL
jgi:hypothetical protein